MCGLASDEEQTFLDPRTGEVFNSELGRFIGCHVENGVADPPRHFSRIAIPAGTIVEICA
jgi:hypothetical protein